MATLLTREECEGREEEGLSPHSSFSGESLGRLHVEEEHPLRTAFQRDRDRLIHSTAFRRLEYKTQVFVNHEGDYYRTRLTHTLEVAQVARSLARFLRLNEDLVEAMALAHDIGHTPFGHSVEDVLDELMENDGGFEHNAQGLRCVDILETPYAAFKGLNLTYEARSIFTKKASMAALRRKGYAAPEAAKFDSGPNRPILEAQVVDLADSIAYNSHDVDDGLKSGLLTLDALQEVSLWREVWSGVSGEDESTRRREAISGLINRQVTDTAEESLKRMSNLSAVEEPSTREGDYPPLSAMPKVIEFSGEMRVAHDELRMFLHKRLYAHPKVAGKMDQSKEMIRELFLAYFERPEQMAAQFRARMEGEPIERIVCDYIAGMTDRFAEDEYTSLVSHNSLSPLKP